MNQLIRMGAILALTLSTAACATVPSQKEVLSGYSTVRVMPLSFDAVPLQKSSGNEQEEFERSKPALAQTFKEGLLQALPGQQRSLPGITFEEPPAAGSAVLEPKLSFLDPGIKGVLRGRGVAICSIKDGASGQLLGTFTVKSEVDRKERENVKEAIEELVRSLGAGTAREMHRAR